MIKYKLRLFLIVSALLLMLTTSNIALGQGSDGSLKFNESVPIMFPESVVLHSNGFAYLALDDAIHKYTKDGNLVARFASKGTAAGQLQGSHGIGELSTGELVITDLLNNRLQVFSPDGEYLSTFGENMFQSVPQGLAISNEDRIFVVDHVGKVLVFSRSGAKEYEFAAPGGACGIAIDKSGFLYVVDRANGKIVKYTQLGDKIASIGPFGDPIRTEGYLDGIAVSSDNKVAVTMDGPSKSVWVVNLNNNDVTQIVDKQWTDGHPRAVAFDEIGDLYVGVSRVVDYDPAIPRPGSVFRYFKGVSPTSTFTPTPSTAWSNTDVSATITSTDNTGGSGVKEIYYSVNMGTEQIVLGSSTSFTLSANGTHSIAYYAVDNAGNTETTKYATVRIDKTRPTVDAYAIGSLVTVIAQDTFSGVASTKVSIDGTAAVDYTGSFTVAPGAHTVTYWATDQAGNESTREVILVGVSVSTVTIAPTTLFSTKAGVGTVKLSLVAPAGGVVVMLDSNSAAVTVPVSVTVPAGALTATFPVTANTVSTDTKVVITASVGGQEVHGTVYVLVPYPKTLNVAPTTIIGGDAAVATVTLASSAGVGGQVVNLASSNANVVVPSTVTVPAGALSATFPVQTSIVSGDIAVAISADADGTGITTTVLVKRVAPKSITFAPASVVGGNSSVATLTVTKPAPAGGIVVDLRSVSSNVSVPATVTIPEGATTATFPVTTIPVKKSESAMIQAYAAGVKVSAVITVTATSVVSISMNPTTVVGGLNSTATVTLNGVAPVGGTTIQLFSTNVAASVPTSVVVPGGSRTVTFPVTTVAVAINTSVSIATKYLGTIKSAVLTVAAPTVSTLTLAPSSLTGGATSKLTIKLSGKAATEGVVVALTSSNTVIAQLPTSVTIPAGSDTVDVTITTGAVAVTTNVTITAKTGAVGKTAVLTVNK